jgi:hypothetical protein
MKLSRGCFSFTLLFAALTNPGAASAYDGRLWSPPTEGVIRNGKAAISIARLIWLSMNPDLHGNSDETWQTGMVASLHNGIWHVVEKLPREALGGGIEIDISQSNAKVTGIYLTQ